MAGFVAIEGLDGVGKSTILNSLAARFSGHAMSTPGPALRSRGRLREGAESYAKALASDILR